MLHMSEQGTLHANNLPYLADSAIYSLTNVRVGRIQVEIQMVR